MPPEAEPEATSEIPSRVLRERVRALFRNLPKAVAGADEPVHQIRVASRRLRVVIPLIASEPDRRRVRRAVKGLRRLTRAAGASRDLDVSVVLFEARTGTRPADAETSLLRRRLRAARARARRRMSDSLLDLDLARMRGDLRALLAEPTGSLLDVQLRLRRARDIEGAAILSDLDKLDRRFEAAALHEVRRKARRLRYTAELAAALREDSSEAPKGFKALQEILGRLHDAWVLAAWLARQSRAAAAKGRADLASRARHHQRAYLRAARSIHREFLDTAPALAVRRSLALMGRSESAA